MKKSITQYAEVFRALGDANRLMIVDMLSGGELCACMILEKFRITQPTLSHHMKILCGCGLVNWRKQGKWIYYTINGKMQKKIMLFLKNINTAKECSE